MLQNMEIVEWKMKYKLFCAFSKSFYHRMLSLNYSRYGDLIGGLQNSFFLKVPYRVNISQNVFNIGFSIRPCFWLNFPLMACQFNF
ncbi:Uncharacterized protein NEOC65_000505 [Neochlamydia sp. AcF65]|nr:Uncharacterized protein [Neochlamydia sp. AcF65]MBS4169414.1 Uncharacterized protein [Neochlamydia sp. AcF95]NGY95256.1 hypothetical protein [Neochlamydia sp. AcF84]